MISQIKHQWLRFKHWYAAASLRKKIFFILGTILGIFIVFSLVKGKPKAIEIETVTKADLPRTVLASGMVVSSTDLPLSFQKGGFVKDVNVTIGQQVKEGQVLATLQAKEELANLTKARGALLAAEARYRKVQEGSSSQEVRLAEVKLANAKKTQDGLVENARRKLFSDDLVATLDGSPANVTERVLVTGSYNSTEEGEYHLSFDNSLAQIAYSGLEKGTLTKSAVSKPLGTRGLLISLPDSSYSQLNEWTIQIPNKDGANYTSNLNAYQAALDTREQVIEQAEAELEVTQSRGRSVDVDAALAEVITAQGSVDAALAEYEKAIVRAPAAGTITKVDVSVGELVEPLTSAITLQDIGNLYLEADINESSITNIAIGQPVTITYDAFGKDTKYRAAISSVDLGATVVDGIVNYKIKALIQDVLNVKPGMTANLSIETAFVPGALVIPSRVIEENNGEKKVQVLTDERRGRTEQRTITTGLRGDGGLVEVTSGLEQGEKLVFTPAQ